jgi:hypothetical protein
MRKPPAKTCEANFTVQQLHCASNFTPQELHNESFDFGEVFLRKVKFPEK